MNIHPLLLAFGIVILIPNSAQALSDEERDAYVLLLTGPKDNQVKSCASAALRLNLGLTAMQVTRSPDADVEESLMSNATTDSLKAARGREIDLWKKTHSPAKVAEMTFFSCTKANELALRPDPAITTCFSLAGVPALADVLKRTGHSKDVTAGKVAAAYSKQIPEHFVRGVVDTVYEHNPDLDNFEAHRIVLGQCIHDAKSTVSEADVLKEYERFKAAKGDKEYRVLHIMVRSQAVADQLLVRLNNGAAFSDLAKTNSIDPGSAKNGGDMGWQAPSTFAPAFAAAVVATAPGNYTTAPVQTPYGWHIVKVDAVRAMQFPAFEQVKDKIRARLEAKQAKPE